MIYNKKVSNMIILLLEMVIINVQLNRMVEG